MCFLLTLIKCKWIILFHKNVSFLHGVARSLYLRLQTIHILHLCEDFNLQPHFHTIIPGIVFEFIYTHDSFIRMSK